MALKRFINNAPEDLGGPLQITGFNILNEVSGYPHVEPLAYDTGLGLFGSGGNPVNTQTRVASGQFFIDSPTISWQLVDPITKEAYSDSEIPSLQNFSGYSVDLYSETGLFII